MNEELFDLVFKGDLIAGSELAQVKKNLQTLFRINESQVDALFSGKAIVLKKAVSADAANTYRVAMKKAGAAVKVVLSAAPVAESKNAQVKPTSGSQPTAKAAAEPGLQTALGAQPVKPAEARKEIQAPSFEVAVVGADLIRAEDKPKTQAVIVDISHLSVSDAKGNLVSSDEIQGLPILEIDIPEFEVAPAGSDVLTPAERPKVVPVEVDTAGLSVAEVGERLSEKKAPPPAAPNVDHIKLAD